MTLTNSPKRLYKLDDYWNIEHNGDMFIEQDIPLFPDLLTELIRLIDDKIIPPIAEWSQGCQIGVMSTPDKPDDVNWAIQWRRDLWARKDGDGGPGIDFSQLDYDSFTEVCSPFKGTLFEKVVNELKKRYVLGQIRIICTQAGTALFWHDDPNSRLHFVMKTQIGCVMVIKDQIKHFPVNTWWLTNTIEEHGIANMSRSDRIHLVVEVLDFK